MHSPTVARPRSNLHRNPESLSNLNLKVDSENIKQPLYVKLRQMLRQRILQDFQEGEQFYSERDLLEKLSASQPTIRRALRDLTTEGYLVADPRRGYFVNHRAETCYVGVIQPAFGSILHIQLGAELTAICREKNFVLVSYNIHKSDEVSDILRMIRHKPNEERLLFNGLTTELTLRLGARLQAEGYRHLLIGPDAVGYTGATVYPDQDEEVNQILDYLTGMGHERIVFMVNEPRGLMVTGRRAEAVSRQLQVRGLSKASLVWCETANWEDSFEAAYKKTREILTAKPWPTAIVPLSGIGAWAVLRYAMEQKIDVPGQLSIISFDATINAAQLPVAMSEMSFSFSECARFAVDLLWSDSRVPVHTNMKSQLVVRKSSGPPPVDA